MLLAPSMTNTQLTPYQDSSQLAAPVYHQYQHSLQSLPQYHHLPIHPSQHQYPAFAPPSPIPIAQYTPQRPRPLIRRRSSVTGFWYTSPSNSPDSTLTPAHAAYESALEYIRSLPDSESHPILHGARNVKDVQVAVLEAQKLYEGKREKNKVQKWLRKLSARVVYYGGILDVLSQHHPEYVSLAWGALKAVFVFVLNHEETLLQTSKTLTRIADLLPRTELASILYPTEAMATAVSQLYACILRFFIDSLKLYRKHRVARAVSSIYNPWAATSKDAVEEIDDCSRRVDALAGAASRAEIRDLHLLVQEMGTNFQIQTHQIHLTLAQQATQFSHFRLTQLLDLVSTPYDPIASLTYCQSLLDRRRYRASLGDAQNRQVQSKLQSWADGNRSSLLVVQGVTRALPDAKDLAFDVVGLVRESQVPVIWALPAEMETEDDVNVVSILKTLVLQTLQIHPGILMSKTDVLTPARFREATTEEQWLDLLSIALAGIPRIFIVVDAEKLFQLFATSFATTTMGSRSYIPSYESDGDDDNGDSSSWPEKFISIFRTLVQRNGKHVKILVVGYNMNFDLRDTLEKGGTGIISLKRKRLPKKLRRRALREGRQERKVGHGMRKGVFQVTEVGADGETEDSSE